MPYIQTKDTRFGEPVSLFYQDLQGTSTGTPVATGSAQPTLVFVHGWPLSHEMWDNQTLFFAERGFRCVAYDRRGFGKSSKPWGGYEYDTFADDLKAVIDELELTNVIVVGFSMGGGEVARYFSRHGGKNVTKAALIGSVTPFLLKTDDNKDGVPKEVFDGMLADIQKDRFAFLESFGKSFYGVTLLSHPVSQAHLNHDTMLASLASPKATADCVRAFSATDFRQDLRAVNVPVLIIHGDADQTVPLEASGEKTHKLLPQATYTVYEGEPHGLFATAKDKLNQDLLAFVDQPAHQPAPGTAVTY